LSLPSFRVSRFHTCLHMIVLALPPHSHVTYLKPLLSQCIVHTITSIHFPTYIFWVFFLVTPIYSCPHSHRHHARTRTPKDLDAAYDVHRTICRIRTRVGDTARTRTRSLLCPPAYDDVYDEVLLYSPFVSLELCCRQSSLHTFLSVLLLCLIYSSSGCNRR
jgi:hypothetical protein